MYFTLPGDTLFAVIYILVLFGSFFGICIILGARVILRNRNIRRFVHGVKQRTEKAKQRGLTMRETHIDKSVSTPRTTAVERQKARSLLREAEKAVARRRYDEAEKILIQALTTCSTSIDVKAQLAKLYILGGRDAKAEALYRELLNESQEVSFYANLGLSCYKQNKFEEACEAYKKALDLDPKNPERAAALGRACMAAKHYTDAVVYLERATERLARDTTLLAMLGECFERLHQPHEAQEAYKKIHRLQPYDQAVKEKIIALSSV